MPTKARSFRMPVFPRTVVWVALVATLSLVFSESAQAGARKARKLYQQGRQAEDMREYDRALELYSLAVAEAPADNRYELAERRMRFVAGQAHVDAGFALRRQGMYEEALVEFEQAVMIDPASSVALQERMRTAELIDKRQRAGSGTGDPADVPDSALEAERLDRSRRMAAITKPPDLEPLSNEPINLMLNEDARIVFEAIGKLAGINVLFDPDFPQREVEIELRNATLQQALDYVGLLTQAFWKPVTHNTVLITSDNPNKRREYEDEVVKTVYLTNLSTPQDLSEVSTAIRGVTDIRRMFAVNSMSAIVMRGSRAKVAIAEKIVHDMDKARPEVIVDILVLESSKSNQRTLGLNPLSGAAKGIRTPFSFRTGTAGSDAQQGIDVARIGGVGSWSTSLPNFQITALLMRSDNNLLQSPRVRAADNQQAELRIGDRIPIATGSFQPGVGGVGINPLVNTQFQYTDVGVNVSLTPKIHANRDVSMHVAIEISNVREFRDVGGISQPVIGQRTIEHDVRVREGEASVIGGLNQSQVFTTRAGVPFLGELPVIGKLFSEEEVRRSNNEILLVLVPHIVRMPPIDESNLRMIASGTDQKFELRYEEEANGKPALPPLDSPAEEVPPAPEPASVDPTPVPEADPEPTPEPAEPEPQAPDPAAGTAAPQGPRIFLDTQDVLVAVGQQTTITLMIGDAVDLVSMPMRVQYDREKLRLIDVQKGPFLSGADASDIIFSRSIRHANGLAAVNISRYPGAGGADGEGQLVDLVFEGVAEGQAELRVLATGPRNVANETLSVAPLEIEVTVQ